MKHISFFILLLLLLLFICFFNLIRSDCKICIDQGENCYEESLDEYLIYTYIKKGECKSGLSCGPTNINSSLNEYICKPILELGGICSKDIECNLGLVCSNNICSNSRFSAIGEPCSSSTDCEVENSFCSIEGVCTTKSTICTSDMDCKYGYYCSSSQYCTLQPKIGESCLFYGVDHCLNSTCQSYYSTSTGYYYGSCQYPILKTLGQPCLNNFECDYTNSLYCSSYSNVCEYFTKIIKPPINGNCSNITGILDGQDIIKGNSCGDFFDCSCNDGNCYQSDLLPIQISNVINPLVNCLHSYGCKLIVNNSYSINSCASRNCGPEMCKYLKVSYDIIDSPINEKEMTIKNPLYCGNTQFIDDYCRFVGSASFIFKNNLNGFILLSIIIYLLI